VGDDEWGKDGQQDLGLVLSPRDQRAEERKQPGRDCQAAKFLIVIMGTNCWTDAGLLTMLATGNEATRPATMRAGCSTTSEQTE
jgi:hypothetical protein